MELRENLPNNDSHVTIMSFKMYLRWNKELPDTLILKQKENLNRLPVKLENDRALQKQKS